MTKRLKLFLIIMLGAIAAACFAVGCKVGTPDREQILASYQGGHVIYYANGGCFNRNTSMRVRELYFKEDNVPFFDISESTDGIDVMRSGYDFIGWYLPETDEDGIVYTLASTGERVYPLLHDDGTPVTDSEEDRPMFYAKGEDGQILDGQILEKNVLVKPSDTAVDSERLINADDNLIVCAEWKLSLRFVFKLVVDEPKEEGYEYNGETYHYGDIISTLSFGNKQTNNPGDSLSVTFSGMTFVANYADEDCSEFVGTYDRDDVEEGQTDIVVYSKYIEGEWKVIRNKVSSVTSMFNGLSASTNKYYIIEDIDVSSTTINAGWGMRAVVEGNGHTISGIKITLSSVNNGTTIAPVFDQIYSTAVIKNLTLKDITISVTGKGGLTFYAICSAVESGAVIQNLTIDGVTATVKIPSTANVTNAQNGDRNNWLFGGKGTDEAFCSAYGVTLKGENTLTITN